MNIDEDSKRKEIEVYDKQCKVWYDFLNQQTNKMNNYFKDTRADLEIQRNNLEERLKELDNQYYENDVAQYELMDQIQQIEYALEKFDDEINQIEQEMDSEIRNKEKFSKEVLQKEKEELMKAICDVKLQKTEEWLKNIKKDLPDGEIKELLKICFRLFYGAKQFSLEEFIENVLSRIESKTEIEAPLEWVKDRLQINDRVKYKLSQFLAKFANFNRQDITKETRQILQQYIDQQRQKQSPQFDSIVNLLNKFQKWETASQKYDQIENTIKTLESALEEKRKAPEYQHYHDYLEFLNKEKENITFVLNLVDTTRTHIRETIEALEKFYEYQEQHREQMQQTISYETRNEEKQLIYQAKEQQIEMK